jgi:hypothetical protein
MSDFNSLFTAGDGYDFQNGDNNPYGYQQDFQDENENELSKD